jgi:hypothetical protein
VKTRPTVAGFVVLDDDAVERAPLVMFDIINQFNIARLDTKFLLLRGQTATSVARRHTSSVPWRS